MSERTDTNEPPESRQPTRTATALGGVGMSLSCLFKRLRKAWCAESSADPNWSIHNRPLGQCAVTALIVQDHEGGDLLRCAIPGGSHYWNRLPDGSEIDLTAGQFAGLVDRVGVVVRDREYVLSHEATYRRYQILVGRLARSSRSTHHD